MGELTMRCQPPSPDNAPAMASRPLSSRATSVEPRNISPPSQRPWRNRSKVVTRRSAMADLRLGKGGHVGMQGQGRLEQGQGQGDRKSVVYGKREDPVGRSDV